MFQTKLNLMGQSKMISPSLMCADMFFLEKDLAVLEACRADLLHIDIMDGNFVPNITLGLEYVKSLSGRTSIPLDIHLMVTNPAETVSRLSFRRGDLVSFHTEPIPPDRIDSILDELSERGAVSGLAIKPATPFETLDRFLPKLGFVLLMTVNPGFAGQKIVPETVEKVAGCRDWLDRKGFSDVKIEVDGNVSFENIPKLGRADLFVCGSSSVFDRGDTIPNNICRTRDILAELT